MRKDVEWMFEVLQAHKPLLHGYLDEIIDVIFACIIKHNMIVGNEREDNLYDILQEGHELSLQRGLLSRTFNLKEAYFALRHDFLKHLWEEKGNCFY